MYAAGVAAIHRDRGARLAIASASAANAMLARTDARQLASSDERWRRFFLASAAHLANVGSATLSGLPIERGEVGF
jgi:hypothetical protein